MRRIIFHSYATSAYFYCMQYCDGDEEWHFRLDHDPFHIDPERLELIGIAIVNLQVRQVSVYVFAFQATYS
jgi:hypothetical protein